MNNHTGLGKTLSEYVQPANQITDQNKIGKRQFRQRRIYA
jgi:hypothetical protein